MLNALMDEFNAQYGIGLTELNAENVKKAAEFTLAEGKEALDETVISSFSKHNGTKELLDAIYATSQQLRAMGVDVDSGLIALHTSNMSKLVPEDALGYEIEVARERYFDVEAIHVEGQYYRLYSPSQNKVVKPTCYQAADVTGALPHE